VRWEPPTPGSAWIRRQVVENMPEPLSPLFAELYLRDGLDRSADAIYAVFDMPSRIVRLVDRPLFTTVNGYAYMRGSVNFHWSVVPEPAARLRSGRDGIVQARTGLLAR
jgi:pyruvate,water dikinase